MRRAISDAQITIVRGNTTVIGSRFEARIREPLWLFRINPVFVLPGLRRECFRNISVNGKRSGRGCFCGGAIPVQCKRRRETYWSDYLENRLAECLGICCRGRKKGYYRVQVDGVTFIIDVHRTDKHDYHCMVYTKHNDDYIGDFVFSATFNSVYTRLGVNRYHDKFCIVAGYVMDALLSKAVGRLTHSLEINC